jgi:hypothetical protein
MSDEATFNDVLGRMDDIENVRIHEHTISFTLPGTTTRIFVQFYRVPNNEFVYFEPSHFIKTPSQEGPYRPGHNYGDDLETAIGRAVSAFTSYVAAQTKKGDVPSDSWLVPNPRFSS